MRTYKETNDHNRERKNTRQRPEKGEAPQKKTHLDTLLHVCGVHRHAPRITERWADTMLWVRLAILDGTGLHCVHIARREIRRCVGAHSSLS